MTDRSRESRSRLYQPAEPDQVISQFLAGVVDQADVDRLEALLADDPAVRRRFRREANLDAGLREWAAVAAAADGWAAQPSDAAAPPTADGIRGRLAAVLAVGLLLGILTSTAVFAATSPWRPRLSGLLLEGFAWEWGRSPGQAGIPDRFDRWGGDYCRLVGAEQGVVPPGPGPMLRMLRSDNTTSPGGKVSNSAELWRFIDLETLRRQYGPGPLRVTFSAAFNAAASATGRTQFTVGLHAFASGNPEELPALWQQYKADDTAVSSALGRQLADRSPASWQVVDVQLLVPPTASVLLVHTAIGRMPVPVGTAAGVEFSGHYIADVSLRMTPEDAVTAQ